MKREYKIKNDLQGLKKRSNLAGRFPSQKAAKSSVEVTISLESLHRRGDSPTSLQR